MSETIEKTEGRASEPGRAADSEWALPKELILNILEILVNEAKLATARELAMTCKCIYELRGSVLVRKLRIAELVGRTLDASFATFDALISGLTAHRLAKTRCLVLGDVNDTFEERTTRLFESALKACRNIEAVELIAAYGYEPPWDTLAGISFKSLKIKLRGGEGLLELPDFTGFRHMVGIFRSLTFSRGSR